MKPRNSSSTSPRICAVSYLNTVPLVWGMLHGPQQGQFELEFRIPSECADRLRAGAADIGIVPSVEIPRQRLAQIRGTGIACREAVRSILLISKKPPQRIRTLAADTSSRTSVMLARIVLDRWYQNAPEFIPLPPDLPSMLAEADAALVIGDPALRIDPSTLPYDTYDLGEVWTRKTGLPMVFAVWGCRNPELAVDLEPAFRASCRFGLERLEDIVAQEGPRRGLSEALTREYFVRNVVLELGPAEYDGLDLFLEYARPFDRLVSSEPAGKIRL